jgi:Holliday junction resolvase
MARALGRLLIGCWLLLAIMTFAGVVVPLAVSFAAGGDEVSGAKHRRKGNRVEREVVALHKQIGVHAERYPLSGASRFRNSGHDLDLYVRGRDEAPLVAEVKARKNGTGFTTLETWLGEYDALFLKRNNAEPLVVVPWRVWATLLGGTRLGHFSL